jgi:hypothetical protein
MSIWLEQKVLELEKRICEFEAQGRLLRQALDNVVLASPQSERRGPGRPPKSAEARG